MLQTSTYHDSPLIWKELLLRGLAEDQWLWDFTTLGTLENPEKSVSAHMIVKNAGVWAASGLVEAGATVALEMGFEITAESLARNGDSLHSGQKVALLRGPARAVLALERPLLNLAAYASGIATATQNLVRIVTKACPNNPPRIAATRKTLPLYRDVAIHAVLSGGGHSHRISLGGGILIKENHIAAAGGIKNAVTGVRRASPHGLKIEVEVRNLDELDHALRAGADGVLLDNFAPEAVKEAVGFLKNSKLFIEISGGINEQTIAKYAIPGVDVISSGAITHSAPALDLSLLLED